MPLETPKNHKEKFAKEVMKLTIKYSKDHSVIAQHAMLECMEKLAPVIREYVLREALSVLPKEIEGKHELAPMVYRHVGFNQCLNEVKEAIENII